MIHWHLIQVEHCHTPGHFGQELDKRLRELNLGVGGGVAIKSYQKETIQQYYLGKTIPKEIYAY